MTITCPSCSIVKSLKGHKVCVSRNGVTRCRYVKGKLLALVKRVGHLIGDTNITPYHRSPRVLPES